MEKIQSPRREMKTLKILLVTCAVPKGFPDIGSGRYDCTEVERKRLHKKNNNNLDWTLKDGQNLLSKHLGRYAAQFNHHLPHALSCGTSPVLSQ